MTLSAKDKKILACLQNDGRISNVALAETIGMSPSPCLRRVKALEEAGYVKNYAAILDRHKLGLQIVAFVEVKVPQVADVAIIERFKAAILREPAIVSCYLIAGQFDFLLKVVVRDIDAFSALMQNVLLRLPGVQDTRASFGLDAIKDTLALPID
jgi:Lrp/AsnC family leucine-responsive transcriptional regulator